MGKNYLLSSNTSSTCPRNIVNFGPQTTEIVSLVWGTPANFNGFRVLAALLHGTLVVKLCGVEQREPPIFGRVAITLCIGPHSSFVIDYFIVELLIFYFYAALQYYAHRCGLLLQTK